MRRSCANCHAHEWIQYRYCEDCWLAALKGAATALGSAIALWCLRLLI